MSSIRSIAIIGSGISGSAAAYLLKDRYEVTLFEKNHYFGGHSNTIDMSLQGKDVPVDTGFIVFNHQTYPNVVFFFKHLGIDTIQSNMSFGVSIDNGLIEYCGSSLSQFFAQRKNIVNPRFIRMGLDILKFNNRALETLNKSENQTIDDLINTLGLSQSFKEWYLYPMAGAIWSTSVRDIGSFPARTMVQFFHNHGLLTITNHPQWYTVKGGSRTYIEKALNFSEIKKVLNADVREVERDTSGVKITTHDGNSYDFDAVIFASPAHKTLEMIKSPTSDENSILGQFKYSPNTAYLHQDCSLMPENKRAWASWSYFNSSSSMSLTYWMNQLQTLDTDEQVFVTLNPYDPPKKDLTHRVIHYEHPIFDQPAIDAQDSIPLLQGKMNTWYCGAYQGYGFHEDGLLSTLRVVNALGVKAPWQ